jgi:flotillin
VPSKLNGNRLVSGTTWLGNNACGLQEAALAEADRDQAKLEAEAEAYRNTTLADAEAQAARVRADATAHAERSTAEGRADANKALAESLRQGNQELIAASRIIEQLPELVNAASRGIASSNLTVLNGAAGVNEMLAGLIGQGLAVLDLLRTSTSAGANGTATVPAAPSPRRSRLMARRS